MITLFFICLTACIFLGIAILESQETVAKQFRFGPGLIGWLTSGNWPAKVGGGLMIIGIGALLRYALVHIDVAPGAKVASGVLLSIALMLTAQWVRRRYGRREIAIALAGASFGIAYLTAYSAYAFFNYLASFAGLALLIGIAVAAGAYATWRNAVSMAVLSMFGAFLAPAFAIDHPTAGLIYGYYLATAQLTLAMVAIRGWRALIHLSFLFTLGGGLFFAWTAGFYAPEHFAVMQPLLLALTATHLAMSLVEQRSALSKWMTRFDLAYFVALPVAAAVLLAMIAPTVNAQSTAMILLSIIWLLTATAVRLLRLNGAIRHAGVAVVLFTVGVYLRAPNWPWFLIGLSASTIGLISVPAMRWKRTWQDIAVVATLLCTVLFVADTLLKTVAGLPFANSVVAERIVAGVLLLAAGRSCRKMNHAIAPMLGWIGAIGLVDTFALEIYRLHIASWPIILHSALVATALIVSIAATRRKLSKPWITALAIAVVITALWASENAGAVVSIVLLVAAPLSLVVLSLRDGAHESDYAVGDRILSMAFAPLIACIWANQLGNSWALGGSQFALSFGLVAVIVGVAVARWKVARSEVWLPTLATIFAAVIGALLFFFTWFCIQRGMWPMAFDLLALSALLQLTSIAHREGRRPIAMYVASAVGTTFVVQAMLLRLLGPAGTLTIADVFNLHLPAVISLFWSSLGAALTILARNVRSRSLWLAGATVLVACAVKLVLFDFGSLGQLANILAVIAAGLMFMLVSWLAPLPPKNSSDAVSAA